MNPIQSLKSFSARQISQKPIHLSIWRQLDNINGMVFAVYLSSLCALSIILTGRGMVFIFNCYPRPERLFDVNLLCNGVNDCPNGADELLSICESELFRLF